MTLSSIVETTSVQEQIRTYNESSGMINRETHSPSAGSGGLFSAAIG